MEKYLHLDSEYKNHWQEYHLANGNIFDSRRVNWRQIEWEQVVKIVSNIKGHVHVVDCKQPNFLFFLCFRWGGHQWVGKEKKEIKIWSTGYSDGQHAFLIDIDFHSGELLKKYVAPLSQFSKHIHPRVYRNSLCLPHFQPARLR